MNRPKLNLSWPAWSWRPRWNRRPRPPRPVREPANLHWLLIVAAAVPALAVAGFAGVQSYSHIEQLAIRAAEPMIDARMLPLSLDGIIVAGVVIILAGSWLGWLCVAPGVAGTLFANLAWGLPHGHLSATVATWPAVAFSVVSFVLERWLKSLLGRGHSGETGPEPAQSAQAVPRDKLDAAIQAMTATALAGNPLSGRQLTARFELRPPVAGKVRELVLASVNGSAAEADGGE